MPRRSGPFRAVRVRFRRALRRLDRRTPEWLRWLAPWWTSITIHALALLVLAVVVITHDAVRNSDRSFDAAFADQLRDDLTSLAPGERSGDPFTTLNSDVPPSLSLDPDDRNATAINVPELPPDVVLGPRLQRRKPTRGFNSVAAASATNGPPARLEMGENRMAPFSGRQGEMRARLVRREGGTVESEKAVERGLDWIARHQLPDGSWGLDPRPACKGNGCPPRGGMICDSAATGLALLPLLGAGHTHTDKGRYQATLRRGLEYLVNIQLSDGEVGQGPDNTRLYAHAIATMALCEAYGLTKDEKLKSPAQNAVNFIVMAQSPIGGWRYNPGDLGDTSVLGWQMFALRSAHLAGLKVPDNAIQGAVAYLNRASADMGGTTYCYMPGGRVSSVMTAEALLIRMYVGWTPKMTSMRKGIALVSADLRKFQDRNIYYWYYATQLLHNIHGSEWKRWNARVRDELIRTQVTDKSCADGSWDPAVPTPDRWGNSAGRHYQTTMSILTLEVYYRYLPLYGTADLQDGGLVEAVPGTGTNRTGRAQAAAAGKAKAKSGEARKTQ